MRSTGKAVCLVPAGDRCGEGPVWHPEHACLYWADINRFLIHRYNPADGAVHSWFFEEPVTALMLTTRADTLAAALASRVILWEPATDARRDQGFRVPGWPEVRLNDGHPGPSGDLWLGSMRNNVNPDGSPGKLGGKDGALFRVARDGSFIQCRAGIGIANTIAWSPGGTRLYTADSLTNVILQYDTDETGAIVNERPLFADYARGVPDGSAIDAEGYLWNCRYGGGCIVRIAPDGALDRVIELPVRNVTSCAFGGRERRTLFVTTAALGAPHAERLAGSLFAFETEIPGLPENCYRLD